MKAVIVGAGPNGLTAAAVLARAGLAVSVLERLPTVGGAASSVTAFGDRAVIDQGAAAHPFGVISPAFDDLNLERHGLEWVHPEYPVAHPLPGGRAAFLQQDADLTAMGLGVDRAAWLRLHQPATDNPRATASSILSPLVRLPEHPLLLARLGLRGAWPASALARTVFRSGAAQALFAGSATHATLPLGHPLTSAFGIAFGGVGHSTGWPFARGGTQEISNALRRAAEDAGAKIQTEHHVADVRELSSADIVLLDLTPRQIVQIAGERLHPLYGRRLRTWHYGPAVAKLDLLLDGPIPWQDTRVERAGTVHVGGTIAEIAAAERAVAHGRMPERPFVLVTQPSSADPTRAADGSHVIWAYAHVPHAWQGDTAAVIESRIEQFAPGFRDRMIARRVNSPSDLEQWNPNLVGGAIGGGSLTGTQQLARPRLFNPYRVPLRSSAEKEQPLYVCSSSTPPGGGVHGMNGWHAAAAVLLDLGR